MSVKRNSTVIPKTINVKTGSCKYTPCCAAGIPGIPGIPGPASPAGAVGSPGNNRPQGPRGTRGYVVVNFLFQLIFIFPLFLGMVMYAKQFKTKEKQKLTEIKN